MALWCCGGFQLFLSALLLAPSAFPPDAPDGTGEQPGPRRAQGGGRRRSSAPPGLPPGSQEDKSVGRPAGREVPVAPEPG